MTGGWRGGRARRAARGRRGARRPIHSAEPTVNDRDSAAEPSQVKRFEDDILILAPITADGILHNFFGFPAPETTSIPRSRECVLYGMTERSTRPAALNTSYHLRILRRKVSTSPLPTYSSIKANAIRGFFAGANPMYHA